MSKRKIGFFVEHVTHTHGWERASWAHLNDSLPNVIGILAMRWDLRIQVFSNSLRSYPEK